MQHAAFDDLSVIADVNDEWARPSLMTKRFLLFFDRSICSREPGRERAAMILSISS